MEIIEREYTDLVEEYMTQYYNEILSHRAIPEATSDALIEVQRRILWTLWEHNWTADKKYVKCAKIVGNAMTYHYHGLK